jgi:hypothetical protein
MDADLPTRNGSRPVTAVHGENLASTQEHFGTTWKPNTQLELLVKHTKAFGKKEYKFL